MLSLQAQQHHNHIYKPVTQASRSSGSQRCKKSLQRWTNTKSGKSTLDHPICASWEHVGCLLERLMEKPANHRHTKLDGLPKDSVKSRELISTNSLLQLHTKTQSGYSSRLSTISTLNAIRSISKRLSSMATLMRQSIVPPEGSNISADKVLHLRKSLYGLKQSPRCFNKAFDEWLRGQGLTPTRAEPCIYTRRQGNIFLIQSTWTINSRATADQLSMHSSTRSTTNSSALTLDRPDTSLASTSIEINRHASFIYLNNITLRQYLTDFTWLIAILHGVLFHKDFDQYQLRMKNTRRHDTVHIPRQLVLSFMRPL